jgi:hypothetical protein
MNATDKIQVNIIQAEYKLADHAITLICAEHGPYTTIPVEPWNAKFTYEPCPKCPETSGPREIVINAI